MHADSRTGNGAVCVRWRARRGSHGTGLDRRARGGGRTDRRPHQHRRPDLRETKFRESEMGARGTRRFGHPVADGPCGQNRGNRARARHPRLFRASWCHGQRRVLVGRDRSEAPRPRRRDRRSHRNRIHAAGESAAHHRHRSRVEYAADRQQHRAPGSIEADETREHRAAPPRRD